MALPAYPNAISLNAVNVELGAATATTLISLNDAAVRDLFVKASGAIAMSDGHGKSAAVYAPSLSLIDLRNNGYNTYFTNVTQQSYPYGGTNREVTFYLDIDMNGSSPQWAGWGEIQYHGTGGAPTTVNWEYHPGSGYFSPSNPACAPKLVNAGNYAASFGSGRLSFYSGASRSYYQNHTFEVALKIDGLSDDLRPVGVWRVEVINSAGSQMSTWIHAKYYWDFSSYPCGCNCDCDENDDNCTGCCSSCSSYGSWADSPGNYNNCG